MEWKDLLISRRTGRQTSRGGQSRTEFQRDYDRIVFSAPFRRMQDKTQVFPLPGAIFVHNRLTHSIEVASVGRSLGHDTAVRLAEKDPANATLYDSLSSIVSAGCLAHDMGNPPFGHSGESAIQHYFANGAGRDIVEQLTEDQRSDVLNFDGNANTFRLLSHSFAGRREGGFSLTYPTLASIIKYPRPSEGVKKFGYFQQDEETFMSIMETLNIPLVDSASRRYARHPLVYLVEAADDICYQVMDVEDAYRLGILTYEEAHELYMGYFVRNERPEVFESLRRVCTTVTDRHERVAYMRTLVIGLLVDQCTDIFCNNIDSILAGDFDSTLIRHLTGRPREAMEKMAQTAIDRIYHHQIVSQIELSGFEIIGTLVHKFIEALTRQRHYYSKLLLPFIPEQFIVSEESSTYDKVISAIDTVSGMTDLYALDLYRRVTGCRGDF